MGLYSGLIRVAYHIAPYTRYRSVPLIRPPHFVHYIPPKVGGGGLYSRMQLVSTISPPPKVAWSPYIGEELPVQREVNNIHDDFAVAVLKNGNTVGHVPREISRVCWYFLHKSGSEMTCIVNGDRRRSEVDGKGLVVPCVYIFRGKQKHLDRRDKPVC